MVGGIENLMVLFCSVAVLDGHYQTDKFAW